jgi:prohibitin 1
MFALIILILLGLATVVAFVVGFFLPTESKSRYSDTNPKFAAFVTAGVALVLTLVVFFLTSITSVEARTVGIQTEFGKSVGTLSPGFHMTAPWSEVTEFPTSTQNLDLDGSDKDDQGTPVKVKFDNGGQGAVNLDVNWRVESNDKAQALWNAWKEWEKVEGNVVKPRAISSTAQVVGAYSPQDATNSSNNETIAGDIKSKLNGELARYGIKVDDVNLKAIDVDANTQARIDKNAAAVADIDTAKAKQDRARIDNETNKLKAQSQSLSPGALVDKCLDVVDAWDVKKNGNLPAGWNCFDPKFLGVTK